MNTTRVETNKLLMDILDFDEMLITKISPIEQRYINLMIGHVKDNTAAYVNWLKSDEAARFFKDNSKYSREMFKSIDEELAEIAANTQLSSKQIVEQVYLAGEKQGYKEIRQALVFTPASANSLRILQKYNFGLIRNLTDDMRESVRQVIFRAVADGSNPLEVAKYIVEAGIQPLEGSTLTPMQRAVMIARTEVLRARNSGRIQSFKNYGVKWLDVVTADDDKVCDLCWANWEANPHPIDDCNNLCPAHPNCRCTVVAHVDHIYDLELADIEKGEPVDITPDDD